MSNELNELPKIDESLMKAFDEIQMARTPYQLEKFVVGQHDTEEQRYAQCVLELQIKYDVIRRALLGREKLQIEQAKLDSEALALDDKRDRRIKEIEAQVKGFDVQEQDRAMKGALREFASLYAIFKTFKKQYSREDMNNAQPDYWQKRLTRQANQDMLANGRISVGQQDALRMAGMAPVPELDHIRNVEQKFLEVGNQKLLVVVPTEFKAENGLPCLEGLVIPSGMQVKYYNVFGRKVHDAYNDAVMVALKDGVDYMLTIEDDTFPPPDALARLLPICKSGPKIIAGAWYPKKQPVREGTPIIVKDGKRQALFDDGGVHECYTLPMGCTLFPREVFHQTLFPWFATTDNLTQDSFFSQQAREAGWKLLCDTSIKCGHVDRKTKEVYK